MRRLAGIVVTACAVMLVSAQSAHAAWDIDNPTEGESIAPTNTIQAIGNKNVFGDDVLQLQKKNAVGQWVTIDQKNITSEEFPGQDWNHDFEPPLGEWALGDYRLRLTDADFVRQFKIESPD